MPVPPTQHPSPGLRPPSARPKNQHAQAAVSREQFTKLARFKKYNIQKYALWRAGPRPEGPGVVGPGVVTAGRALPRDPELLFPQ